MLIAVKLCPPPPPKKTFCLHVVYPHGVPRDFGGEGGLQLLHPTGHCWRPERSFLETCRMPFADVLKRLEFLESALGTRRQ